VSLTANYNLNRFCVFSADTYHQRALHAFRVLGPSAACAIPELMSAINTNNYGYVMSVLAGFGQEGVMPLTSLLTNEDTNIRQYAAAELSWPEVDRSAAIPALINSLNDTNSLVCRTAIRALGEIATHYDVVVPALTNLLNDHYGPEIRETSCLALQRFVTKSPSAVAALRRALSDPDENVRSMAESCLGINSQRPLRKRDYDL